MRKLVVLFLALVFIGAARAGEIDDLRNGAVIHLMVDWRQTQQIVEKPGLFYETNYILGPHPSMGSVNRYFMASVATTFLVSEYAPRGAAKTIMRSLMFFEGGVVQHNWNIGLKFNF